jgi:PAS domain S-box-containing protein
MSHERQGAVMRKLLSALVSTCVQRLHLACAASIPDHVWIAAPDGTLEYLNQRLLDYFGATYEEVIVGGWLAAVHRDDLAVCIERWSHSLRTGEPYEVELRLRRGSDGAYFWHLVRAVAFRDPSGKIVRWFGTNGDISERKRLVGERDDLKRALARSNQELDQFAYVASHDLKAPLRAINNLSHWIEEDLAGRMTAESRGQMALLRGRVRRMEALIDGILIYSRAGRALGKSEDVDVRELILDVVKVLAPPARATIELRSPMPVLHTDRAPLQQVFLNLISNGLKHAHRDDVRIELSARDAGTHHHFVIADNGPGIAPAFHDRIFEMFQTLEARDKSEGTGIGLSIVKKIVEARSGRVWMESRVNAGATFHFSWPRQQPGDG